MCGVFGIRAPERDVARVTFFGLFALQHRGQEAAGIVTYDGKRFHSERRLGLVGDTFSRRDVIDRLPGTMAVGHVRYSTTGATILRNVQPLFAELNAGGFAVAHNGNLTNGMTLRRQLVGEGAMMQSTSDTEVILHLVARARRGRFIDKFIDGLRHAAHLQAAQHDDNRRPGRIMTHGGPPAACRVGHRSVQRRHVAPGPRPRPAEPQ